MSCGAEPFGGDGTVWCELDGNHAGLHRGTYGDRVHWFRRIRPGTSTRARERRRVAVSRIMRCSR